MTATTATAPTDPDHGGIELLVKAAQADMVLTRHRASNWLGVPMGALICWVLWYDINHAVLAAWLVAKAAVSVWRVAVTWLYDRDHATPERVLHWSRHFDVALAADGVVFGLIGTLLLPTANPVLAAIMVATLLGIASVGLVVLAFRERSWLALILPTLVPSMLLHLSRGDRLSVFIGIGIAVFLFLVLFEGRKAAGHTRDMLRLRFQMDELAQQRAEALLLAQRNSAVKDRFLATMSHEMRTPLHGILGLARMLQRERHDGGAPSASLLSIEHTGEHLLSVINDVLDFSKIQAGHLHLVQRPFDLPAVVAAAMAVAQGQAGDKALSLEFVNHLSPSCWVHGDATRLRQILLNLTSNAVKFTARGGVRVELSDEPNGRYVLQVTDTGPGVPAVQREAIFDAFRQLDDSDQRSHGGTGLGLTISRQLARAMGGELSCIDSPAAGAVFRLSLPWLPAPAAPEFPSHDGHSAAQFSGHLLLAEDNAVNALVAEATLRHFGIEVDCASDGEQAVALFAAGHYDLVLMDCQMPVLDGYQATQQIRALEHSRRSAAVPIIALTAHALEGDRERSLAAGMDDHLTKPYGEEDLLAVLRRYLPARSTPAVPTPG